MVFKKTYATKLLAAFLVFVIFLTSNLEVFAADNDAVSFDGTINVTFGNGALASSVAVFQSGVRAENGIIMASYKGHCEAVYNMNLHNGYIYYGEVHQFLNIRLISNHSGLESTPKNGFPSVSLLDSYLPEGIHAKVSTIQTFDNEVIKLDVVLYFDEYIPASDNITVALQLSIDSSLIFNENYMGVDKEFLVFGCTKSGGINTNGLKQNESDTLQSTGWKGKVTKQLTWIRDIIESGFQTLSTALSNLYNRVTYNAQNTQKVIVEGNEEQKKGNELQQQANELQEENNKTQKSIFSKITDFFNSFFDNLSNLVLRLVVPTQEELSTFFDEINTWFSDRLGFLWYPFDLAVRIVSLFGTQTKASAVIGSNFKIPEMKLNMLGTTYTIYGGGSVDMDAFGIFTYVRYFTSFLIVAGIIRMAIHKWDEWIGGHTG